MKAKSFGSWLFVSLLWLPALGVAGPDGRLLEAVKQGDQATVRALLKAGVDVNTQAGDGASAVLVAVSQGHEEMTRLLIQAGASVNKVNDLSVTPLLVASSSYRPSLVAALLEAQADPNIANESGVTSLMMASRLGDLESVKLLLAHGAKVNAKEHAREQTALMWATVHHHADVVQALIDAGADLRIRSRAWRQYVLACCREYVDDPSTSMFVDFGGYTALMYAAQQGDLESARRLLAAGARVDEKAADGMTALVIAAFAGRGALASYLLEQGADPSADDAGYSALHVAVLRRDIELAKALIARGANVTARLATATLARSEVPDYTFHKRWIGATPFWLAVAFHDLELARILAASGADPQVPKDDGSTPLIAAAGLKKKVDLLPERRQPRGNLGFFIPPAADDERVTLDMIKFLVELGVDLNAPNADGDTALHRASARRHVSVVKFLVESGARLDTKNKHGLSPLGVAVAERPFPTEVASSFEENRRVWAVVDAPRDQLVALLRDLGAKE